MGLSIFRTTSKLVQKFLSQTAFLTASEAAIYLASMVESVMLDYITLHQTTAAPPRVNNEPDIDFLEYLSPQKSESVYPNIFRFSSEYTNI